MITMAEAARATGGRWLRAPADRETPLRGGAFDTRALGGADIFFALAGEGADGHDYLHTIPPHAVKLLVVSRPPKALRLPGGADGPAVLRVPDTLAALADMGAAVVARHRPRIVAVTGSYGKTTAKEVIAAALSGALRVMKTPGSLNNEIGVPVSLLSLEGTEDVVVLEFSARKPGDIAYLGRLAPPDVAVLLNVGHAHIGVFGSREAIYRTKGEIFTHLRPGGLALVGAEDPRLAEMARAAGAARVLTCGDGGDFRAEEMVPDEEGRHSFTAVHGRTRLPLRAGMPGPHGPEPVLAAWAVARELGVDDAVFAPLAGHDPGQKGRLNRLAAPGGVVILDDCYNASPETVVNLIETLNARPERDKVLVLGPLAELEAGMADTAASIARALRPPLTRAWVYDPLSSELHDQLRRAGVEVPLERFAGLDALFAALKALDAPDNEAAAGTVVGIKGARSAHMERAVQALLGVPVTCRKHPCSLLLYCTDCNDLTGT